MPQLIRIQPQEGVPSRVPYGQASAAEFGADVSGAVAQGAANVGASVLTATDQYAKIYAALGKEDRRLNLVETLSALKDEYAARDVETRSKLGTSIDPATGQTVGLDPVQYVPTMRGVQAQLLQKYERNLKYPDTAAAFRAQALPFLTEQGIKTRYEGLKLQQAMLETRDGMAIERLTNQAVLAPTEAEQRAAFGQALDIVRTGVESGRYSGEQGAAKVKGILSAVDRGTAMRDFRNPALQLSVIDRLVTGTFSKQMSAEEQYALAHTLTSQRDAQDAANEAKVEKGWKAYQEQEVATLWRQAETKTKADGTPLTREDIHAASARLGLNRVEIAALTNELAKAPDEAPSDRVTFDRVSADVTSYSPRSSEQEIKRLHAAGLLTTKDRNDLLAKRTSRITHLVEHGESRLGQQQAQAEQRINAEIGGFVGIMPEGIDPSRKQAVALAHRDLSAQSSYFPPEKGEPAGGRSAPLDVVDSVIARYRPMVAQQATLGLENAARVAKYKSMAELDAAFPTRSGPQYRAERDLTRQYLDAVKAKQEADQKRADTSGKKPTKSGTFSSGTALPEVK